MGALKDIIKAIQEASTAFGEFVAPIAEAIYRAHRRYLVHADKPHPKSTPETRRAWMERYYGGKPHPYDELIKEVNGFDDY